MIIEDLIVTQNEPRDGDAVHAMRRFVALGGHFTRDARLAHRVWTGGGAEGPIRIAALEDGRLYVQDGHHRLVAMHAAGRGCVRHDEYQLVHYAYRDYTEVCLADGWMTPFDPRVECRLPDLSLFKSLVMNMLASGVSQERVADWVSLKAHLFKDRRRVETVADLAAAWCRMGVSNAA